MINGTTAESYTQNFELERHVNAFSELQRLPLSPDLNLIFNSAHKQEIDRKSEITLYKACTGEFHKSSVEAVSSDFLHISLFLG